MKLLLSTLLLTASISDGFSQTRNIVGRILSADDQKPIKNANIILLGTTRGTFSNHLGYFGLEIQESDPQTLVVSHIGFSTSEVNIPESNNFKLQLNRDVFHIADFDMAVYESIELDPYVSTPADTISIYSEENARYPGGWEYFINGLGKKLEKEDWKYLMEDKSTVSFGISETGKLIDLSFDSLISTNKKVIEDTLLAMPDWIPAKQRGVPVKQYFTFSIRCPETFQVIEDPARPRDGMNEFYRIIAKEMKYPAQARRLGIQGVVIVEFIIEEDGSITNAKIVKGIGGGCDEEVLRIISIAPKWKPGTRSGKPVKQRMVVPITFKLG